MRALYLDGSPKAKDSASAYLLGEMERRLPGCDGRWYDARDCDTDALAEDLRDRDALLIAFPLYVDSLPSHLIRALMRLEPLLAAMAWPGKVYGIVNCGFFDARQNHIALDMLRLWCERCGAGWGQGVAVGGGGMVRAAPLGKGPCASIGKAFDSLAVNIMAAHSADDMYVEPNFPRFLYKVGGHAGWRAQARENGLHAGDIRRRLT